MQVPLMPDDHDNRTTRVERYEWNAGRPAFPRPSRLGTALPFPSTDEGNTSLGQTLVKPTILVWTAFLLLAKY